MTPPENPPAFPGPPREETQREKDAAAFTEWDAMEKIGAGFTQRAMEKSWHAALAHEREPLGGCSSEEFVRELLKHTNLLPASDPTKIYIRALLAPRKET